MNLDQVTDTWRSQDLSALYDVDKTLLHQALRQEQAKIDRRRRRVRRLMYVVNAVLFVTAVLFLAIMIDPNDDDVPSVWDYTIGGVGVASAIFLAGALVVLRRFHEAREQRFDDSLRGHVRRRIAAIDDEATGERRLAMICAATTVIGGLAISIAGRRINDVPYSEFEWWPPFRMVVVLTLTCVFLFRWAPRWRQRGRSRKAQLDALLKQLED